MGTGRVLPKQRDAFVELRLTNPDMLGKLLPDEPVVALNQQEGVNPPQDAKRKSDLDAEILRLTTEGATAQYFQPSSNGSK